MAMTTKDYDFLAKIMKEQIGTSTPGSIGERIKMMSFRIMAARMDKQYPKFNAKRFFKAAGIARPEDT